MSQETWNREELYEKVWSKPVVKVAEEYGVSDGAIAKVCKKLSVPVPGRDYWAKKEHGHTRKPLPKVTQTVIVTRNMPSEIESAQKGPELHKDDETEFDRIDQWVLDSSFAFLTSPKALRHPLIVATRSALREGGADDRKIQHPHYRSRSRTTVRRCGESGDRAGARILLLGTVRRIDLERVWTRWRLSRGR